MNKLDRLHPGFKKVYSGCFISVEHQRLKIMFRGLGKRGRVEGDFRYYGRAVEVGETFVDDAFEGSKSSGRHLGQCLIASGVEFHGMSGIDVVDFQGAGCPYDKFLATLSCDKWKQLRVWWSRIPRSSSSVDFIVDNFVGNPDVRMQLRDFVPLGLLVHYDGAYVNMGMTTAGFAKLVYKLEGVRDDLGRPYFHVTIPDHVFEAIGLSFLSDLRMSQQGYPLDASRKVVLFDKYRKKAAYGFCGYEFQCFGTKGQFVEAHFRHLRYVYWALSQGESIHNLLPPPCYDMSRKNEVRTADVDPDKIRLIMNPNMMTNHISELTMRPMYHSMKQCNWYLGGLSVTDTFLPKLLLSLHHPLARHFFPEAKVYRGPCVYLALDIASQDNAHLPKELRFLHETFYLLPAVPEATIEWWTDVLSYELGWSDCKVFNMWGGHFVAGFGVVATGQNKTAAVQSMHGRYMWKYMLSAVAPKQWLELDRSIGAGFMGDDTSARVPLPLADHFFPSGLPGIVAAGRSVGITYKASQSHYLRPCPEHQDRFFTHIRNDEIISQGLVMLKRHWVKFSIDLEPLHPDAVRFHAILPWRSSDELVARIALCPENWKSHTRPWVNWFKKAFGLLLDAGCNKTCHDMIVAMIRAQREAYPDQWFEAVEGFKEEDYYYHKMCRSYGQVASVFPSVVDSPESFKIICALYLPSPEKVARMWSYMGQSSLSDIYSFNL